VFAGGGLVLIEWGERFVELMPAERTEIRLRVAEGEEREVEVREVHATADGRVR
jgi:tRNA A37 threonylcarbamoyladenosine biosynthesis protein TsaE